MAKHEVIVTDVTRYGNLFCVAGWDRNAGQMIRPEPPGANAANEASRFWEGQWAGPGKLFSVGNIVKFEALPPRPEFQFPHATEDRIVNLQRPTKRLGYLEQAETVKAVAAGVSPTLEAAFDGALVRAASGKAYVPVGSNGRSLGAIEIDPDHIVFHEDKYDPNKPKLRAYVTSDGKVYDLPITADAARARWEADGIAALRKDAQTSKLVHVRVGLARPFPANECYAQVNGVYFQ